MFDYELEAEIKRVEVLVPKVDGPVAKAIRITLRRELDVPIARSLGGEFGTAALKQLHDRGIRKIEFPIDAISARAVVKGVDRQGVRGAVLEIPVVTGMNALAKAKKLQEDKEPDSPMVELKFQFPWSTDAWAFLGDNACTTIVVKLQKNQLDLPLAGAAPTEVTLTPEAKQNGKKTRRKKGDSGNKSSHGDDRAAAAGEIADDAEEPAAQSQPEREAAMDHDEVWQ